MTTVDFWFDLDSPRCWLAAEELTRWPGVAVAWWPLQKSQLVEVLGPSAVVQEGWSAARVAMGERDLRRALREASLTPRQDLPPAPAGWRFALERLAPEARGPAVLAAFRARWTGAGEVPGVGLSAPAEERAAIDQAVARGVFDVPMFGVGQRLWLGHDRLPLVRAALGLSPAPVAPVPSDRVVEVIFDFSSPYAYLGYTALMHHARAMGFAVRPLPVLLGALFREVGAPDVPMLAMHPLRRAYIPVDLADWAAHRGVPFRFNSHFPLRTVTALRAAILHPEAIDALFRAAWMEDVNLSEDAEVARVLDHLGLRGVEVVGRTQEPAVKGALRSNTDRAVAAGACGVPSFVVGAELFWGQDRLEQVLSALAG